MVMRNNKGFTLIEMIMVIILLGIIAAVIAIPLSQGVKGWFQATSREAVSQSGRIGIERMAREIRNTARIDSTSNPTWCPTTSCTTPPCYCPCISTATATNFVFSDMSGDISNTPTGCISTNFNFASPNITLNGVNLADNVTQLNITYYNSANTAFNPTTPELRATICRLSIEIISTQGGETLRKYEEIYLANMRGAANSGQLCQTANQ